MSFKGEIRSLPLSDVLQNLSANQKSGTLSIQSGEEARRIRFRDGKIVSYGDDQGFSILEWLTEKGVVPEESRQEVLRRWGRARKKTLGEVLRDMGLLDLESYRTYFADLLREALFEALSVREGTFSFSGEEAQDDMDDREALSLELELNPVSLLMEAARRADDWEKIRRHLPSEDAIYQPVAPLDPKEIPDLVAREAAALMDGTRTVRQVVSKLPYTRFDACRAVANLIEQGKVRPLDTESVLPESPGSEDPRVAIARLKAALEREPSNREILRKLAELNAAIGNVDESATFHKLLAISFLEAEDLAAAEECLRKSLGLNVRDPTTWQKLWYTVRRQGNREEMLSFGCQFLKHMKELGLREVARDQLIEMVHLFPENLPFRLDLAEILFTLGENEEAVEGLSEAAGELVKRNRLDDAERVFVQILRYDRDNPWARQLYDEIRSGRLVEQRAWRRRFVHNAILVSLLVTLCALLGYELHVHGALFQATKSVFAEGLLEDRRYDEAIDRIQAVQKAYPFSLTTLYKTPPLLRALHDGQCRVREGIESPRTESPTSASPR